MTINSRGLGTQWQSPEHVNSWFADEARQTGHKRLRAKLVKLLPFEVGAIIRVLDIGTGDGALSLEVLAVYPEAQLVCHDFSETMLARARQRLAPFSERVVFAESDLRDPSWTQAIQGMFDAVVSSVAIHNVAEHSWLADPVRIREIYSEIFGLVKPGGCFFNYDHVYPPGPVVDKIYRKERATARQPSLKFEVAMEKSLHDTEQEFNEQRSNKGGSSKEVFGGGTPGARTILNQLEWLKQAGFDEVDCLWEETHVAIIGGFRY